MKNENTDGLKPVYLELENFKNIDKKIIDIGGRSMLFMGRNGSGKSSLIQAITSTLDAKSRPSEPIKKGEERAKITQKIAGTVKGEYLEYTLDVYFTQKDKKGRLVVTNKLGEVVKNPATVVKSMIGNVSFDVTKWMNDDKNKKLEVIKSLTGCGKQVDMINISISEKKSKIKASKDRAEQLEGSLSSHEFSKEEIEIYSNPVDISGLQQQLSDISKSQQSWDSVNTKVQGFIKDVDVSKNRITSANNEKERLRLAYEEAIRHQDDIIVAENSNIEKNTSNIKLGTDWLNSNPRPSIDTINDQINKGISHNEKYNRLSRLGDQQREVIKLKDEIATIESEIAKLEKDRTALIASSQLSIPGLKFDDNDIYIDDMPLEEGQINTARIFDISVDIAMALNPTLKVIFLHDGSLFDKDNLAAIIKKIEDKGYMAIVEVVDFDGGDLEVKFTETELK